MSPSSPVSVGIIPSCRTLVVGSLHRGRADDAKLQFLFSEDPFTDYHQDTNTILEKHYTIIIRYSHAR